MSHHAHNSHPWLYVIGHTNKAVEVYDLQESGTPQIGEITDGVNSPGGVAVDPFGDVIVANESGTVSIYAPGSVSPSLTLSQGLTSPQSATPDAGGNVWVCNRGNPASIVVFLYAESTPSLTIQNGFIQIPTQIAFDAAGDLFYGDNNTGVSEIPAGSQQMVSLGLQGLQRTDGLVLDPVTNDLFVGTFGSQLDGVRVYAPGNVVPIRTLQHSDEADLFAIGTIHHKEYFFAPDSATNEVHVFKDTRRKPMLTLETSVQYAVGVGFKPAGVP